jgi:type II secretory pathway component PulM
MASTAALILALPLPARKIGMAPQHHTFQYARAEGVVKGLRQETALPRLRVGGPIALRLAGEEQRLAGQTNQTAESPQQLKLALEQSIAAAGLKGSMTQLTVAGELIDLRFKGVPFAGWLGWFDSALRETRLRAVDVALERESAPGLVSARVTLEVPKRGP